MPIKHWRSTARSCRPRSTASPASGGPHNWRSSRILGYRVGGRSRASSAIFTSGKERTGVMNRAAEEQLELAVDVIRDAESLALACHVGPDGDALGSMLALHHL